MDPQLKMKVGWMFKQGGVRKSWNKRWFILKGTQLSYYTSPDESKQMGTIHLSGNKVVEQKINPSEPDKFPFEIVPGSDKSRMTLTHETYPLYVCNEVERKSWIQVIKKALYGDKGGAIFGQQLFETMNYESQIKNKKVPCIVEQCVEFILTHGLDIEGIFRLPGRTILIKQLKETFDCGEPVEFILPDIDVHTVASLLKLYFRELPEPIIPKKFYEPIMKIVQRDMPLNEQKAMKSLQALLAHLPKVSYNLIQFLCQFLNKIGENEGKNKMNASNLATVFVNSVIRPEDEDPALLMGTSNGRTRVTFIFITECHKLFSMEYNAKGEAVKVGTILDIDNGDVVQRDANEPATSTSFGTSNYETISEDLLSLELNTNSSDISLPAPLLANIPVQDKKDLTNVDDGIITENKLYPDLDQFLDDSKDTSVSKTGAPPIPSRTAPLPPPKTKSLDTQENVNCTQNLIDTNTTASKVAPMIPPKSFSCEESNKSVIANATLSPQSISAKERSQSLGQSLELDISSCDKIEGPSIYKKKSHSFSDSLSTAAPREMSMKIAPARPAPPPPPAKDPKPLNKSNCDDAAEIKMNKNREKEVTPIDKIRRKSLKHDPTNTDISVLLNTSVDEHNKSQLLQFIDVLKDALRKENNTVQKLSKTINDVTVKHKTQLNDMAKTIDAEKKATADAVEKIVILQSRLQNYNMQYGSP